MFKFWVGSPNAGILREGLEWIVFQAARETHKGLVETPKEENGVCAQPKPQKGGGKLIL